MSYNCINEREKCSADNVVKAMMYADRMHKGQKRKSGPEYICHPVNVASFVGLIFNSQFNDSSYDLNVLLMAAYLHDTLEDTDATFKDLVDMFGSDVATIVNELTTDRDMKNEIGKAKYLAIKMKNMSGEALLIKLCDRLDNTSDLMQQSKEFRIRYFKETYTILCFVLQNRHLKRIHLEVIRCIIEQLSLLKFDKLSLMQPKQRALRKLIGLPKQAA